MLSRRQFARVLLLGSAASWTATHHWSGVAWASVAPMSPPPPVTAAANVSRLRLRLADFPALTTGTFGSVRLGFTALNVLSPAGPLLISRDGDRFLAVSAECTHEGVVIPAFRAGSKDSICPRHGSRFALDGTVLRGPAGSPLPSFNVLAEPAGYLTLELPDFPAVEVTVEQVESVAPGRVALTFLGIRNLDYEVLEWSGGGSEWTVRPFSGTPQGPATQTTVRGTGAMLTVYAERTGAAAILAVGVKVRTV